MPTSSTTFCVGGSPRGQHANHRYRIAGGLVALLASLSLGTGAWASPLDEEATDRKAGLLSHQWRIFKLPSRGGPDWPAQVRFGLPPYPQQAELAQRAPAALIEALNPVPVVPVPTNQPAGSTVPVIPQSGCALIPIYNVNNVIVGYQQVCK